jgi:hypothetical protein
MRLSSIFRIIPFFLGKVEKKVFIFYFLVFYERPLNQYLIRLPANSSAPPARSSESEVGSGTMATRKPLLLYSLVAASRRRVDDS